MISEIIRRFYGIEYPHISAKEFARFANRARQRKKGPVVRRGRRYP